MMRKVLTTFMVALALVMLAACGGENGDNGASEEEVPRLGEMGLEFITALVEGNFDEATANLNETMEAQLTPEILEETWDAITDQLGQLLEYDYNRIVEQDGYQVVLIDGLFEADEVTFTVAFDENEEIGGFHVNPRM